VRVRRRETITHPAVRDLLLRAATAMRYRGTTSELLYAEIAHNIAVHALGVFLGIEEHQPRCVFLVVKPTTQLCNFATVFLAYNEGKPSLAALVGTRAREWLKRAGCATAWALNLEHKDAVFMRTFSRYGGEARVIGSLVEFQL
jgi:hypothetical protein